MTGAPSGIIERLPHRSPFLFISTVIEIAPLEHGRAVWEVRGDEAFFIGHFPERPIVPGVLLGEALAQLSGLVAFGDDDSGAARDARAAVLAQIDVRFRHHVTPPARVQLASRLVRAIGPLHQFDVEARVDGAVVASGSLVLTMSDAARESARKSAPESAP